MMINDPQPKNDQQAGPQVRSTCLLNLAGYDPQDVDQLSKWLKTTLGPFVQKFL